MFKVLLRYSVFIGFCTFLSMPVQGAVVREWFNNLSYIRTASFDLFSIKSNSSSSNIHSNKDGVYSIAFGKDLMKFLSTEVLLRSANKQRYQEGSIHNVQLNSLFFNVYLKGNSSQTIVPYLMGGVGAGYNSSRPTNQMIDGNSNSSMLYDIGAGLFIKITNKLLLDFNCKHVNLGSVGVSNNPSIHNVTSRELLLNLVYKF